MSIFKKWFGKKEESKPKEVKQPEATKPKEEQDTVKEEPVKKEEPKKETNRSTDEKVGLHSAERAVAKIGDFAISSPMDGDPRFKEKVVLLSAFANEKLIGVTPNEKTDYKLGEIAERFEGAQYPVYLGGPINKDDLFYLHTLGDEIPGSTEVLPGLFFNGDIFGADLTAVAEKIRLNLIPADSIRFILGFAYWGVEQLAEEVTCGSRYLVPADLENVLFSDDSLWKKYNDEYYNGFSESVYPRLKLDTGEDSLKTMYADINGKHTKLDIPESQQLVSVPYGDDLRLYFVFDRGEGFQYVQNDIFEKYPAITKQFLLEATVNSLGLNVCNQAEIHQPDEYTIMITAGGNHEADLVRVPLYMDNIHEQLEQNSFLVGIPAQDLLFICPDNEAGMDILRQRIEHAINSPDINKLLSTNIYRRKKGEDWLHKVAEVETKGE